MSITAQACDNGKNIDQTSQSTNKKNGQAKSDSAVRSGAGLPGREQHHQAPRRPQQNRQNEGHNHQANQRPRNRGQQGPLVVLADHRHIARLDHRRHRGLRAAAVQLHRAGAGLYRDPGGGDSVLQAVQPKKDICRGRHEDPGIEIREALRHSEGLRE